MDKRSPKIGETVAWKWGSGVVEGRVVDVLLSRAEIISKGKHIVRNGSPDNPAIIIDHKSGNQVLKLASELLE